jgi:Outer membrane protein beta-barrel domain
MLNNINKLISFGGALALAAMAHAAFAQSPGTVSPLPGFYGGVSLRDAGGRTSGIDLASISSAWVKYGATLSDDDTGAQSVLYGGYRFGASRFAVEAALARSDGVGPLINRPGVGLALGSTAVAPAQRYRADVYSSYSFAPAFALYGRLGYQQQDSLPSYLTLAPAGNTGLQGVNYGVGLRYDMSPSLGLKLEYARFAHMGFDGFRGAFPESDQVQLGVQYRF